jgi:hypothetical protein
MFFAYARALLCSAAPPSNPAKSTSVDASVATNLEMGSGR